MEALFQLDGNILLFIQEYIRQDWMTPIWKIITLLGDGGYFWIALSVLLLIPKKTRKAGIAALLAMLINMFFTNIALKNLVARPRPYDVIAGLDTLIKKLSSYSFPSGHTACSFAVAFAYYRCLPQKKWGIAALVLAGLIGFSRLYVGVHYPTDVLGGAAVGIFAAWIASRLVVLISDKIQAKRHEKNKQSEK